MTVGQARFVINIRCLLHCTTGTSVAEMAWWMSCSHSKHSLSMLTSHRMAIEEQTFFFFLLLSKLCSPWSCQKWVTWVTEGKNEVENVSWTLQHSRKSTELAVRRAEIHKEELNGSSCAWNPPRVEEKRPKCEARGEKEDYKRAFI